MVSTLPYRPIRKIFFAWPILAAFRSHNWWKKQSTHGQHVGDVRNIRESSRKWINCVVVVGTLKSVETTPTTNPATIYLQYYFHNDLETNLICCSSYLQSFSGWDNLQGFVSGGTRWTFETPGETEIGWVSSKWWSCREDVCGLVCKNMYWKVSKKLIEQERREGFLYTRWLLFAKSISQQTSKTRIGECVTEISEGSPEKSLGKFLWYLDKQIRFDPY